MSETTGRSRGNPAPRRALARYSPRAADEGAGPTASTPPAPEPAAPAGADPGGTGGRDLLIPGRRSSRPAAGAGPSTATNGKVGRPVPSLADLMPPANPRGRRPGHGHAPAAAAGATKPGKADKGRADKGKEKTVDLTVRLPKSVRKQLKARAQQLGLSPEQTVVQLLEVWLEG